MMSKTYFLGLTACIFLVGCSFFKKGDNTSDLVPNAFAIDTLATDLTVPWEIVFLPDKTMLFTERDGKVRIFRNGKLLPEPALTITEIDTTKKMGLLGMAIHPKFNESHQVYLAHNYRNNGNAYLRILRYSLENDRLITPTVIIDGIKASQNHTGSRLKFGPDGKLYITTGDADQPILAQDLTSLNGKILRINDDGSVPKDNPFVENDTVRKEIWSYGHRNVQGIDFQPGTDFLYNSEHGPTGGDEINRIYGGANYGWPIIHHGETKKGMFAPLKEYTPSVGPSEILFYNAEVFPFLKGNMLMACLRGEGIIRFSLKKQNIVQEEVLFKNTFGRIRALTLGPDGLIYFSTSQKDPPEGQPRSKSDMVLRLRPATISDSISLVHTSKPQDSDLFEPMMDNTPAGNYRQLCASCHGENLEGSETAQSMRDGSWEYASDKNEMIQIIKKGVIEKGMPAWEGAISEKDIEELAEFILEKSKND